MHLSRIINPPEEVEESRPARRPLSPTRQSTTGPPVTVASTETTDEEEPNVPPLSFIICMEAKEEGKVTYASPSVLDVLGWDPEEVVGTPAANYCHPDDVADLYRAYQEMIDEDKAACLMYHRENFKDRSKGYLLCSVTVTRVGGHLIGASSPATSEAKAMRTASTASEVIIITPSASRLAFRRWNVPSPTAPGMSPSTSGQSTSSRETTPPQESGSSRSSESPKTEADELIQSFRSLTLHPPTRPEVAKRVAFVLNRFSRDVPIIFCTNDDIVPSSLVMGRSFFDFVAPGDEARMRQAIDAAKSWSVSESGFPAEGGFAFNRFRMYLRGRDSCSTSRTETSRRRRSLISMAPFSAAESSDSSKRRKQHLSSERGVNAPAKDILLVDSIFSPQSDGIIVIIRPALQTGVRS